MLDARLFPELRPHADPRLIASNHLMQLSTTELEQAISQELEENPALELVERSTCPRCGAALHSGFCQRCTGVEPFTSEAPFSSETGQSVKLLHSAGMLSVQPAPGQDSPPVPG